MLRHSRAVPRRVQRVGIARNRGGRFVHAQIRQPVARVIGEAVRHAIRIRHALQIAHVVVYGDFRSAGWITRHSIMWNSTCVPSGRSLI